MSISPIRFVDGGPMRLAGLIGHFSFATMSEIPKQWERFVPYLGKVPGQVAPVSYGLCYEMNDQGFQYMSAVEVDGSEELPAGLETKDLPAHRYVVFAHEGVVTKLNITIDAIWHTWLPASGEAVIDAPIMFERYGENFDPVALKGDLEVWIAIK